MRPQRTVRLENLSALFAFVLLRIFGMHFSNVTFHNINILQVARTFRAFNSVSFLVGRRLVLRQIPRRLGANLANRSIVVFVVSASDVSA